MRRCQLYAIIVCISLGTAAADISQFNFDGNLNPAMGPATLEFEPGTEGLVTFGTVSSFGLPALPGGEAWVMSFPAFSPSQGLRLEPATSANGGGEYVNEYTLIYDLLIPNITGYFSFYNTDSSNSNDGEAFIRGDGGIGISGVYSGTVTSNQWHRIAFVWNVDTLYKYIDGVLVGTQAGLSAVDGRWSLYTTDHGEKTWILADNDNEMLAGYISSFMFANEALDAATIAEYDGPDADGPAAIPYTVRPDPYDGEQLVDVRIDLQWTNKGDTEILGYDVYFGTDPNDKSPTYDFTLILDNQNVTSVDPAPAGDLDYDTVYYWKIDYYEPNSVGYIQKTGKIWSFKTSPAIPVVITDPESLVIPAGTTAEFTVKASNADTYSWFKSQDAVNNTPADDTPAGSGVTLSLADVQLENEGFYYCVVGNDVGEDVSGVCSLAIARLIHHWPFDDASAADVAGSLDATVVGDPNWIDGIDGGAISLFPETVRGSEREDWVILGGLIPGTDPQEYDSVVYGQFDFSVSFWMKSTSLSSDPALLSNKDWDSGSNNGYVVAWGDSRAIYQWNFDTDGSNRRDFDPTGPVTNDGAWHLVTISHDRDGMATFYIDGQYRGEVDISAHAGSTIDTQFPTVLGNDGMQNYHEKYPGARTQAAFDDVRIYNYALDSVEVATLYTDMIDAVICPRGHQPAMDQNDDCKVDIADLAMLAEGWLECGRIPVEACE